MKTDRLFAITIYLLNHGKTSAKELAEKFEVSVRTIQRDIDSICMANIPIVAETGANGGYYLAENFTINANTMTEEEYDYTLMALKGLASAIEDTKVEDTIEKFQSIVGEEKQDIQLDFSSLKERDTDKIVLLREAMQTQKQVIFEYTNAVNEIKIHTVEPIVIIYRWYAWYLIAYSPSKDAYGVYKLVRMSEIEISKESFQKIHEAPNIILKNMEQKSEEAIEKVCIRCGKSVKAKVIEYLNGKVEQEYENGDCDISCYIVPREFHWFGALMALGNGVEVLEPEWVKERLIETAEKILKLYQEL